MVKAGLEAIYLSGWQVAADANLAGQHVPRPEPLPGEQRAGARAAASTTRCCAPTRSTPPRATNGTYWLAPIVADAEAGFGGPLNAFELMKAFIEAGAAGVHFEDQLSSEKKCGHLGGKVLVPTSQFVRTLVAARLAADVARRPDRARRAHRRALARRCSRATSTSATASSCTGERTPEGFFRVRDGHRGADRPRRSRTRRTPTSLWCETSTPDLDEAEQFAEAIHEQLPGQAPRVQLLAVVQLARHLDDAHDRRRSSASSAQMGYRFQFVTLAGFHALQPSMFELARGYARRRHERLRRSSRSTSSRSRSEGYTATRHQREVGAGYFDAVLEAVTGGESSTLALKGSTEEEQFEAAPIA